MAGKNYLTIAQRERAFAVTKTTKTYAEAVRALRRMRIYISVSGLRKLVYKVRRKRSVADRRRSGRPRTTATREDKALVHLATRNRFMTLPQLSHALHSEGSQRVSRQTVSRRLKERGLFRRVAVRRPLLTRAQKRKRREWARKYLKAGIQFWSKVNFSDEKIFEAGRSCARVKVSRKSGEKYHSACIQLAPKRGVKIHVWGLISWHGVGPLRQVVGNLNAAEYQRQIIFDIDQLCNVDPIHPRKNSIFQQDKAPAHMARTTLNFLAQKGVSLLPWPGNSPDLNPIENVWSHVCSRVRALGLPASKEQYWNWVQAEWQATPLSYIRNLYRSLPSRCREVVGKKGGSTHY